MREFFQYSSVEDFFDPFSRASDDGSITPDTDGAIHHLRVFEEKTDHSIQGVVIFQIKAQFPKGAWMEHFLWRNRQKLQESP